MDKNKDKQTDEEIIQSVLTGDKEMFSLLVNRYQRMVLGYGYQLSRNQDTASDLVQETFITAYNSLDRLKEPAAFPGWLLGILKNKWQNLGRENKIPTISLNELGLDLPDSGQSPMYSEEQLEKISNYVSSLPEKYREVVLLKYLQDFSYKEIARILEIPVTTVTMRLIYARKFLMKKAKEDGLL